jgi:CBS-domain-containing membrane protein
MAANQIMTLPKQGASAVLVFGAIEVPLAQPRALVFGHFFSALIGVCIIKLFSLMPDHERFESLRWLAASLSTALAIVVMQLTGTTHPPAGATALLPATDEAIYQLSWYIPCFLDRAFRPSETSACASGGAGAGGQSCRGQKRAG